MNGYSIFIICWIVVGLIAGLYLIRKAAPFGRFSNSKSGPMISNKTRLVSDGVYGVAYFHLLDTFKQLQLAKSRLGYDRFIFYPLCAPEFNLSIDDPR